MPAVSSLMHLGPEQTAHTVDTQQYKLAWDNKCSCSKAVTAYYLNPRHEYSSSSSHKTLKRNFAALQMTLSFPFNMGNYKMSKNIWSVNIIQLFLSTYLLAAHTHLCKFAGFFFWTQRVWSRNFEHHDVHRGFSASTIREHVRLWASQFWGLLLPALMVIWMWG